mmetsp:Transcript_34335/g.61919  ORF Transcript_34335/g.61919 Transcript_34335/m.61919 type:complete len:546 (-) Transcript_34335:132-1769(-)
MSEKFNTKNASVKRILQEIKELKKDPPEDFIAEALEDDIFEWHFVLIGPSGTEFEGGLYHGRILLPFDYPMKPPAFMLLTPSGRFEVGVKVCLSISNHHPEHWQPSWSVRTALQALIAHMPTPAGGALGALEFPKADRQDLAIRSLHLPPTFGDATRQLLIHKMHTTMIRRLESSSTSTSSPKTHMDREKAGNVIEEEKKVCDGKERESRSEEEVGEERGRESTVKDDDITQKDAVPVDDVVLPEALNWSADLKISSKISTVEDVIKEKEVMVAGEEMVTVEKNAKANETSEEITMESRQPFNVVQENILSLDQGLNEEKLQPIRISGCTPSTFDEEKNPSLDSLNSLDTPPGCAYESSTLACDEKRSCCNDVPEDCRLRYSNFENECTNSHNTTHQNSSSAEDQLRRRQGRGVVNVEASETHLTSTPQSNEISQNNTPITNASATAAATVAGSNFPNRAAIDNRGDGSGGQVRIQGMRNPNGFTLRFSLTPSSVDRLLTAMIWATGIGMGLILLRRLFVKLSFEGGSGYSTPSSSISSSLHRQF